MSEIGAGDFQWLALDDPKASALWIISASKQELLIEKGKLDRFTFQCLGSMRRYPEDKDVFEEDLRNATWILAMLEIGIALK